MICCIIIIFGYICGISPYFLNSSLEEDLNMGGDVTYGCKDTGFFERKKSVSSNEVVTVEQFSKLILFCHFCSAHDDGYPKVWLKKSRFSMDEMEEVQLGMHSKLVDNRVFVTPDHSLVITNVTREDEGIYNCHATQKGTGIKYNYSVDVTKDSPLVYGKLSEWPSFKSKIYSEIELKNLDFEPIRNFAIVQPEWKKWGPCDGCAQRRMKIAECHVVFKSDKFKLFTHLNQTNNTEPEDKILNKTLIFFNNTNELSCSSLALDELFPTVFKNLTLSSFAIREKCYAPCRFSSGKDSIPKYKNTLNLREGEEIFFKCPEASSNSDVVWKKDGITLFPNYNEGHTVIDSFSNLHIKSATEENEGNYTCYVEGDKMQEILVLVTPQSKLTQKAFLRHMQYLGYALLISAIFYALGIVIAWTRRNEFRKLEPDFFIRKPSYGYWKLQKTHLSET